MSPAIRPLTMPKWGLSMKEGRVVEWLVAEGVEVSPGEKIADVETDKILASVEAQESGLLRRWVAKEGEVLAVGALLAVLADETIPEQELDQFILDFQANFKPTPVEKVATVRTTDYVTLGNRVIRYLKRGEKDKPVILIHGFGGNLNNWLFNHEILAANYTVYALDLPGHGESTNDVGNGNLSFFSKLLQEFMEVMNVPTANLVGHSLGGAIALTLALDQPSRVASLTLIGSAGLGPEINGAYIEGFIQARRRKDLKPHLQKLFSNPSLVTRQLVEDVLSFKRIDGVGEALRKVADQFCSEGTQNIFLGHRLPDLSIPALVVWGAEDQVIPVKHAYGLPGNLRTKIIAAAGHMVQMESASEVNRCIIGLINPS